MSFELNGWLKRLNYVGQCRPDFTTLAALVAHQAAHITFENLDVLLRRPMDLSDDGIYAKLVTAGRGGYCFELNGLMARGLRELGFEVRDLAARVLVAHPPQLPARTHRMLQVTLDGTAWLVDVGFGGQTPTVPLRLSTETAPHPAGFRLVNVEEDYQLEYSGSHGWQPLYRFDLQRQYPADYQMANDHVANDPHSHFRHHLMLSLPGEGMRMTALNHRVTQHDAAGDITRELPTPALYQALKQQFNLGLDAPGYAISLADFERAMSGLKSGHRTL